MTVVGVTETKPLQSMSLQQADNGGWVVRGPDYGSPLISRPIAAFSTTKDLLKGLEELLPKDVVSTTYKSDMYYGNPSYGGPSIPFASDIKS